MVELLCGSSLLVLWLLPPVLICLLLLSYLWTMLWLRPERLRQRLRSQGVKGPKPSLLLGNIPEMRSIQKQLAESDQEQQQAEGGSHRFSSNYMAALFPYFLHWNRVYGSIYLYSTRSIQCLFVTDPDMVKEVANCKSLDLGKPRYLQKQLGALFGMGIVTSNGDLWAHQRKVIAPHLFMDKVKGMVDLMAESASEMLVSCEDEVDRGGGSAEVVVDEFLMNFSADVISRAAFGSSFSDGKEVFSKIRQLQMAMAKQDMFTGIPGSRYLPTQRNREIQRLGASIRDLILDIARRHEKEDDPVTSSTSNSDGLLRSIVKGAKAAGAFSSSCTAEDFIVDNCKNIYFAGHETTSTTASWCLMLLAAHPEWQSRARAEVLDVIVRRGAPLDADSIWKLKTVTMVMQETLRLYPPAPFVTREALRDLRLGGLRVPSGSRSRWRTGPRHMGRQSRRVRPRQIHKRRRGSLQAAAHVHAVRRRRAHLHWAEPRCGGAQGPAGAPAAPVRARSVARVRVHRPAFRLTVEPGSGVALVLTKLYSAD